jgi:predicted CoA-binding protein
MKRNVTAIAMSDEMGKLSKAIAAFLEPHGWSVMVVGPVRIEGGRSGKYRFRFVADFVGAKKEVS